MQIEEHKRYIGNEFDFTGKYVVIVGASRGIGLETGIRFAYLGAMTYFLSRTGNIKEVAELCKRGLKAEAVKVNAVKEEDVNCVIKEIVSKQGTIDILVNNLGINQCVPIEQISLKDWNRVINTNLTSMFLTCKACLPVMKKKRYGKIINVSSVAARNKSPVSGVHYVASKAAILGFTRQLAQEAAPFGININAVCPGQTTTSMLLASMTEIQQQILAKSIPLQRIALPEEQANVILFLASDISRYMSGAIVDVNGGQM